MYQEQPSWVVPDSPPLPTASSELVFDHVEEATRIRQEQEQEREAQASTERNRIIGLAVLLVVAAAAGGAFMATMNPLIDEPVQAAAANIVDDSRTLQGGVPIRQGLNNGEVRRPVEATPIPSGEPN
ncbi:MAG: hypothetical protein GWP91_10595 [Rhodobacterales bacterium]|nr:hypothetical protein [Rhodobacterales bacterium]